MNKRICDFVFPRTEPDFFDHPDATLCEIQNEIKKGTKTATEVMTIPIDQDLKERAEKKLSKIGWTLEEAFILYLYWCITSEVRVTDIPELKAIYDIDLTGEEYDALYNELSELNEKCKATRSDACNMCFGSDTNKCLMKIFTTFPDYRPSPHNGHEFGDIAFPVTYNGERAKLVGAMKRALKSNLTRSTPYAREMFHQVFVLAQNSRIDIVAAVCPSRFQDQFREDLEYLSKLVNKPLIILDDLYMCRQLKAFKMMQSENLDRVKLTGEN